MQFVPQFASGAGLMVNVLPRNPWIQLKTGAAVTIGKDWNINEPGRGRDDLALNIRPIIGQMSIIDLIIIRAYLAGQHRVYGTIDWGSEWDFTRFDIGIGLQYALRPLRF